LLCTIPTLQKTIEMLLINSLTTVVDDLGGNGGQSGGSDFDAIMMRGGQELG